LILHREAQTLRESLSRAGKLCQSVVAEQMARHPRFQNIDYPLAIPPLLLDSAALDQIKELTESYVSLLEKVVKLYRNSPDIRRYFRLGSAAEELIDAERDDGRAVTICRLDGYIDSVTGHLRVLENNADSPAGTLFTSRLNRLTRQFVETYCEAPALLPMDDGDPFIDILVESKPERDKDARTLRTAVFQVRGRANKESEEIAGALRSRGHSSHVVDPRDVQLTDDGLVYGDAPLDVVWNKINIGVWKELIAEAPQVVDTLARACGHSNAPIMLNSYGSRHVAEAKTSLAFQHDPRFSDRFTPAERALVERLVPWTARLERDVTVRFEGVDWPLEKLLLDRQKDLVLKDQYDIRGDGVTVGLAESATDWRKAIERSWDTGASVQRYVKPAQYLVQLIGDEGPRECNISLDSFVFCGRLVGLGAKASRGHKVNLFQGGSKLAVMLIPTDEHRTQ
jgi:hypothetical protein